MTGKSKTQKTKLSDRDRKFYNHCERLIGELCKVCSIHRGGESLSRDMVDPCADEYADKLAANTAFYTGVETLESLRTASEQADMTYETCEMEHTGTG